MSWILWTIVAIAWARWFWQGYAYRGGYPSTTTPLLVTILVVLLIKL